MCLILALMQPTPTLSGTSGLMQKIKVLYDILLRIFLSSEDDCKYFLKDGITQEDESDKSKIKKQSIRKTPV